jgi:hypothetical protein
MRSIPPKIALALKKEYGLRYFVETGTYKGDSALWAAEHFEHVWTIENWPEHYRIATERYDLPANITFILGDSRDRLPEALIQVPGLALVWLDAHWIDKRLGIRPDDCPLLDELAAIRSSYNQGRPHVVMIDDADFYTGEIAGKVKASPAKWPNREEIGALLPGYTLAVQKGVIVARPTT